MTPTGVKDLSVVTDKLVGIIRSALTTATPGFSFTVSGSMPESVRNESGCQISFYLYQVAPDPNARSSPTVGSQISRQRPLGLELRYLLTVFAGKEYVQEQHALTIAMRALQDNPYLRLGGGAEEITVSLEMESIEKLGMLWQAISSPFRLTAVYKAAIAFLAPTDVTPAPQPKPTAFTLTADPTLLPFADSGQLMGTYSRITYLKPDSTPADLKTGTYDLSPATAAPGQQMIVYGAGLKPADQVFLLDADGSNERNISAWRAANAALHTPSRIVLVLPATVGAVPANSPPPGIYQIRTGSGTARTNAVPVAIAAAVTGVSNPPLLAPVAGLFTLAGVGFLSGKTEVLLETVAFVESAAAPTAGEFQIGGGGTSISFRVPATLESGRYGVRVRTGGVESGPSWWLTI
jgi:hypothetical protein